MVYKFLNEDPLERKELMDLLMLGQSVFEETSGVTNTTTSKSTGKSNYGQNMSGWMYFEPR